MYKFARSLIDGVTMYRLMLYYLISLIVASVILSAFGVLNYKPLYIIISTLILLLACWGINRIFAYIFEAPYNPESSIITALILALIVNPNPTGFGILFVLAASGLAIASKYILAVNNKHIFNPAALAVFLTSIGPHQSASWWVGSYTLLPVVIVGGLLIMIKVRREKMVFSFFGVTTLATIFYSLIGHTSILTGLHSMVFSSPLLFLGFVMLTEPLTSPTTSNKQGWYGALVGAILPPQVHLFNFYSTPEISLLIGNIFSFIVSPKKRLFPVLQQKLSIAKDTIDFVFNPQGRLVFQPGQYVELTLPHSNVDSRGSRRYFTIASSPTEEDMHIAVKFYDDGSSFKTALQAIDESSMIAASQVSGDFVLPKDPDQKIVFIAGGIGITPFRSMVKYLIDTQQPRKITLLYSARTAADIAYRQVFEQARNAIGLQTIYALTDKTSETLKPYTINAIIDGEVIKWAVPDYLDRVFYISGTHPMVQSIHTTLLNLGVERHNIKIDFFPGYA